MGEWVGAKEGVARVLEVTPEKEVDKSLTLNEIAWGYVNEKSLYRLQTGANAVFIPDDLKPQECGINPYRNRYEGNATHG